MLQYCEVGVGCAEEKGHRWGRVLEERVELGGAMAVPTPCAEAVC